MTGNSSLTYRDAGVDIDAGNALVERIKPLVRRTHGAGVLSGLGGFGGLFELPRGECEEPVLVAGTDGVGTKLRLAIDLQRHDTIGQDLVAMCANDVVVAGARPLFFLDYYASGRLDVDAAESVVGGIVRGCELAGCALIGGETAELPGMYADADYDLAGFCVGLVDKRRIIDGKAVRPGDTVLGLAASGPHSNGYSLIRRVLAESANGLSEELDGEPLADLLLAPTRIYVRSLLELLRAVEVHALAHITGGGLLENLPRVLPDGTGAQIHRAAWPVPPVFGWLQAQGNISDAEMFRTFNCGIGMIVVVAEAEAARAREVLENAGERCWQIGRVTAGPREVALDP